LSSLIISNISINNFKCFKGENNIPVNPLTILIGENDCGKSSVCKALDYFFKDHNIEKDDFFKTEVTKEEEGVEQIETKMEKEVIIQVTFDLSEEDIVDDLKYYIYKETVNEVEINRISIKKTYSYDEKVGVRHIAEIKQHIMPHPEMYDLKKIRAGDLRKIYPDFGLVYEEGLETEKIRFEEYVKEHLLTISEGMDYIKCEWKQIKNFMPIFEMYDSSSYDSPTKFIQNILKDIYTESFYETDADGKKQLLDAYSEREEIFEKIFNKEIQETFMAKLKTKLDKIKKISTDYEFNYGDEFKLTNIRVDLGNGLNPIGEIGEGSKKRIYLAIMEWEKEKESKKNVIRYYDEPDASLHITAQKNMYYNLKQMTEEKKMNFQVFINTHSLQMIDRARANSIIHLVNNEGESNVNYLKGEEDDEIRIFLNEVSEISGLKNSSIFLERCFLLFEGYTEEKALPIIYKRVKDKSPIEDGIVLHNLETNTNWQPFLKLLNKNKASATILTLDSDTKYSTESRVTREKIKQIGFPDSFVDDNIVYFGEFEFEDVFDNHHIVAVLNKLYPKYESEQWAPTEVQALRGAGKFSSKLAEIVKKYREDHLDVEWDRLRKPEFGEEIARVVPIDYILEQECFQKLFEMVEEIIA
jgi:putative ATP-dependent endonuclease of the OLD family